MTKESYRETFGVLILAIAAFTGAYLVNDLIIKIILALIGVGVLGLWIFRYVAEGLADSQRVN